MKYTLTILITLTLFTACELQSPFVDSKEKINFQKEELQAKISQEKQKLQVHKELELAKLDSSIQKEEILSKNIKEQNNQKLEILKYEQSLQEKKYYMIFSFLIALMLFASLFIYFYNRRKDKLRAYEDNLSKYFKSKENEAKLKITNKIIDTIASNKLSLQQENILIQAINDSREQGYSKLKEVEEEILELEVIEDKKKSKKSKKRNNSKDKKDTKKNKT